MFWLEPLVEIMTPQGRIAYGPVTAGDAPSLFESGFIDGAPHRLNLGFTENISLCGTDPVCCDEFKQELLEQVTAKPGVRHYGEVVQEATKKLLQPAEATK